MKRLTIQLRGVDFLEFKIMTYNIHHGMGIDKRLDLYRIAEVIDNSNADIIGLNEVDKLFSKRSDYEDQVDWLAKQLKMESAFGPSLSLKSDKSTTERQYGNALLSRYSIVNQKNHLFNFMPGLIEGRSMLETTIRIKDKLVQVYVTHLSLNPLLHRRQTDFIIKRYQNNSHPMILMGDCNMRPRSTAWNKITNELQDVWRVVGDGNGYTYPSLQPRFRLDYIFVSPKIRVIAADIVTKIPKASDHLPLKAILSFN